MNYYGQWATPLSLCLSAMNNELQDFLEAKHDQFNRPEFISTDPISIPHRFSKKEDIEIIGLITATIAWGQRKTIINNGNRLCELMGNSPFDFVMNHDSSDLTSLGSFVHRTFNGTDCKYFIKSLKNIYKKHDGLETVFATNFASSAHAIMHFREIFFEMKHEDRTQKHVSNPAKGASAKRLNMYLRWMVRNDNRGVDFGLWKGISPAKLSIPLDVHTGNVARKLGLLHRTQNDWQAVQELDEVLRKFDCHDPVKYDFALFGLGAFEKF